MWFVMHVKPGTETQAVELLKSAPKSDGLQEVFCPMAECLRNEHGEYEQALHPMIEGAVFIVAPGKRELRACTRPVTALEAVYDGHPCFEAMEAGEEEFINHWAAPGDRVCVESEGWINRSGSLTLEAGPLFERQDDIRKFSRSRRWAYMETRIAGKPARAMAGVRITRNEHLHLGERKERG